MRNDPPAAVVDASVAAKWHLTDEQDSDRAASLLAEFVQGNLLLVAPAQIRYEIPSSITVATTGRQPRLTLEQGHAAIKEFLALDLQTANDQELIVEAYQLVHQYGCAFYDALYLALAQRLEIPLITADRKLFNRIGHLPEVVWIADYIPSTPRSTS